MRPVRWILCAALSLLCATPASSQQAPVGAWLAELNRDVWFPFMEGVNHDEEQRYLAVRSREYIRIQADAGLILTHKDYLDDTVRMMARYRERGTRLAIEVRFDERITNGVAASERGVTRVLFQSKDSESRTYYSRFHTISRKENGVWRVLTDYAPAANEAVTEEHFMRAHRADDISAFRCYMPYPEKKQRCDER